MWTGLVYIMKPFQHMVIICREKSILSFNSIALRMAETRGVLAFLSAVGLKNPH